MLHLSEKSEKEPVRSAILALIPGHAQRYIPRAVQMNIPKSLSKMYMPLNRALSHTELYSKSEEVFAGLSITKEQVLYTSVSVVYGKGHFECRIKVLTKLSKCKCITGDLLHEFHTAFYILVLCNRKRDKTSIQIHYVVRPESRKGHCI